MLLSIGKAPERPRRDRLTNADRLRRGIWLGPLLAVAGAVWAVPAHGATCGGDAQTIARADVVFVGTLSAVNSSGDVATFAVAEVWSTGELAPVVEVTGLGGAFEMPPAGAADVSYLVLAQVSGGGLVVNNECDVARPSLAFPWDSSYAAFRPAAAHPPNGAATDAGLPTPLLAAAGIALLVALISAIAFRRPRG